MSKGVTPTLALRRFCVWSLICGVSAAPSFVLGTLDRANRWGMASGVLIFVGIYTFLTCTSRFQVFYETPHVRPTLRFGYGVRLALTGLTTLAVLAPDSIAGATLIPDLFCGLLSVKLVTLLLGSASEFAYRSFGGALLTTCIQGTLLNAIVFLLMLIYYFSRRKFGSSRSEPRGFEVIMPVSTITNAAPASDREVLSR